MRIATVAGRAHVVVEDRLVATRALRRGRQRVPADPTAFIQWLHHRRGEGLAVDVPDGAPALDEVRLGPPVPRPSKILAVGINYKEHAAESGRALPDEPVVFARLPSALCGPTDEIVIPEGRTRVDWEAELVAVIGRRGKRIPEEDAWSYVAGVTCGQDISDREEQFRALRQFTMGKSYDTYAPTGPVLVSPDELPDPDDLAISCRVDGEVVQSSRTSDLIFPVATLVAWISRICTLEPGDLIFTGTPAGVGEGRKPPRYLAPGNVVETEIEGVGVMRNRCIAG